MEKALTSLCGWDFLSKEIWELGREQSRGLEGA